MAALEADRSGWVVIEPVVEAEALDAAPRTGGLFSGRGPAVPELSWVPGRVGRRGPGPVSVGVRHASGPRLKQRLADEGHPVPHTWTVVDDNPRRGFVAQLPDGADPALVLDWLLTVAESVTAVPLTGRWQAVVHRYV